MAQPSSEPGSRPGKITAPVRGCISGLYIVRAVSTCAGVRQVAASPALHSITLGSNLHARGFSMMRSVTPSSASQASSAALWIAGYFSAGMWVPSPRCCCWAIHIENEARPVVSTAGAPATMPSKSSG